MPAQTLLTTTEAATFLGYHPEHIRRLVRQGKLVPTRQVGCSWLFAESYLKQWAKKRKREIHPGA